ncbi:MAG: hypothetical protein HWD59_00110 [Coxiellaceae bacterium]|nr:MAG: hypothetical protein HWD59_00110 [Coxiellaceae bacterium]
MLLNKQSLYAQIQANIEQNDAIISSRSNWLREIDTSDPILYATDPGRSPPNHIYYFYFLLEDRDFFYYREGVPFVRVEKTPENSFQDEINEPSIGIYKGKYYARGDADVSLKIFVEKEISGTILMQLELIVMKSVRLNN